MKFWWIIASADNFPYFIGLVITTLLQQSITEMGLFGVEIGEAVKEVVCV